MVNIAIYLGKSSQSFQHKIYTLCIYVFICQLHWVFLAAQRIFSSCRGRGGQGSWIGLFFLRLTGSREQAQQLWPMDLAALQYVCAVCPGRGSNQHPLSQQEILNYWTTREGQDAGLGVGGEEENHLAIQTRRLITKLKIRYHQPLLKQYFLFVR